MSWEEKKKKKKRSSKRQSSAPPREPRAVLTETDGMAERGVPPADGRRQRGILSDGGAGHQRAAPGGKGEGAYRCSPCSAAAVRPSERAGHMSRAQIQFADAALNSHYIWHLSGSVWAGAERGRHTHRRPFIHSSSSLSLFFSFFKPDSSFLPHRRRRRIGIISLLEFRGGRSDERDLPSGGCGSAAAR